MFVLLDRLSKYAHFIAMKHPYLAATVANQFIENVVRLHGFPRYIVNDRDAVFLSKFWQDLFLVVGT